MQNEKNSQYIGKTVKVLFEEYENGYYKGHTTNYMVVKVPEKEQDGFIDNIKDIEITENDTQTEELIGK